MEYIQHLFYYIVNIPLKKNTRILLDVIQVDISNKEVSFFFP